MTALSLPDPARFAAWRDAVDEFGEEAVHGSGFWHLDDAGRRALTPAAFAELVTWLHGWSDPATELPENRVHSHYFWITDGVDGAPGELVGFLALRHALTPWLLEEGGHIGYAVRPTRRREGHATRALGLAVRRAAGLGLDRVLVTCDDDNVASARTIELNDGRYEDTRNGKRRYWIDTA